MLEGSNLEFKRIWNDSAKKTVVAFANTDGGTLLVGVDDDGTVCGLEDTDASAVQIVNSIEDGIKPALGMFVKVSPDQQDGLSIVRVEVQRATDRPYYLSEKGIRPSGVYVRRGTSSVPASDAEIRAMIKDSAGDSFEETRAIHQDLTFVEAQRAFREYDATWGDVQMRSLGLISDDGLYTNLAWLLSDQCAAETKAAVFEGETKLHFKTRREFSGSLLRQFREIAEFIDVNNGLRSTFENGYRRVDTRDYPVIAVRESLLNALVHRDYSFAGPMLVSVFDSRMEFVNLGGLPKGLTKDDAMMGVSVQRNPKLAHVFYRLKLIEAYGTGIPKIIESYAGGMRQPVFDVSDNAFKVTLPSRNGTAREEAADIRDDDAGVRETINCRHAAVPHSEREALSLGSRPNGFTRAELQEKLGVSQTSTINVLKRLISAGKIAAVGGGRSVRYIAL